MCFIYALACKIHQTAGWENPVIKNMAWTNQPETMIPSAEDKSHAYLLELECRDILPNLVSNFGKCCGIRDIKGGLSAAEERFITTFVVNIVSSENIRDPYVYLACTWRARIVS